MATPVSSGSPSTVSRFLDFYTSKEESYVKELVSLIGYENGREKCKELGQKIFDEAKAAHNGATFAAKAALLEILNAIERYDCPDALLRKKHIARAWNGVGDNIWTWVHYSSEDLPDIPPS